MTTTSVKVPAIRCSRCGGEASIPYGFKDGVARTRCGACGCIMSDPGRRRQAKVVIPVPSNASSIDVVLALVAAGVLSIDATGSIWKHFDLDRWGYHKPVDPPRRADRIGSGGYRYIFCRLHGRAYAELAHRVIWTRTFGPIPHGLRIGGGHTENPTDRLADLKLVTWAVEGTGGYRTTSGRKPGTRWSEFEREARMRAIRCAQAMHGTRPRKLPTPRPLEYWPFLNVGEDLEPLVVRINASVPKTLPEELRQEVCQDIAVAVLSGEATVDQIPGLVRDYKNRVLRTLWPYFERRSLDAPVNSASRTTFAELT